MQIIQNEPSDYPVSDESVMVYAKPEGIKIDNITGCY